MFSRRLHLEQLDVGEHQHKEQLQENRVLFAKEAKFAKQSHLLSTIVDIELALVQLDADMHNSNREAERDEFDQRNNSLQTLIIAASVMIASIGTLLIQGNLSTNPEANIIVAYGAACGLSFASLFLCIVYCIEILYTCSRYMRKRAKWERAHAKVKSRTAREFIEKIHYRDSQWPITAADSLPHSLARDDPIPPVDASLFGTATANLKGNAQAPQNSSTDKMWIDIEDRCYSIAIERIKLETKIHNDEGQDDFDIFFQTYCKSRYKWATCFFYVGAFSLLAATILWAYPFFTFTLDSSAGFWCFFGLLAGGMIWGSVLLGFVRSEPMDHILKYPRGGE